jgi:hypothetical protein
LRAFTVFFLDGLNSIAATIRRDKENVYKSGTAAANEHLHGVCQGPLLYLDLAYNNGGHCAGAELRVVVGGQAFLAVDDPNGLGARHIFEFSDSMRPEAPQVGRLPLSATTVLAILSKSLTTSTAHACNVSLR